MAVTLLLVEDERDMRDLITGHLSAENPQVEILYAGSVFEGIRALSEHRVDLMVLDLALPDGMGFNVLDQLRRGIGGNDPQTPVLVYSALDIAVAAPRAEARGADCYVPKSELGLAYLRTWVARAVADLEGTSVRRASS